MLFNILTEHKKSYFKRLPSLLALPVPIVPVCILLGVVMAFSKFLAHKFIPANVKMGKVASKKQSGYTEIGWVPDLAKGQVISAFTQKPLLLMILKSWCPTCKMVYPKYITSKDFQELSRHFVMVKCVDDNSIEKKYAPDGHYVPRILFFAPNGELMSEYYNFNPYPGARYFYPRIQDLLTTMRNVLFNTIGQDKIFP